MEIGLAEVTLGKVLEIEAPSGLKITVFACVCLDQKKRPKFFFMPAPLICESSSGRFTRRIFEQINLIL